MIDDAALHKWFRRNLMRKLIFALVAAGAIAPSLSNAQVKIDMTRITCGVMLAMPAGDQADFAAFMAGWFAQKSGRTFIDLSKFLKNSASVKDWCASNPNESVMAGLQRAFDQK
ncbi:MAG: HdeA/HdeB family chaperone [Methylocystis sp.]